MTRLRQYVMGYDIGCNRRRRRALRILRPCADLYQDSVFDCRLTADEADAIQQSLTEHLDEQDALFCIALPEATQSWQLGTGLEPLTAGLLVIE